MASVKKFAAVAAVVKAVRLAARPGGPTLGERAGAMPRLVRATLSGAYPGITKGRLALMLAATGYIVSPIDLLPDVLGLVGLADDAVVMGWLATRFVEETEAFLEWERAGVRPTGPATTPPGASSAFGASSANGASSTPPSGHGPTPTPNGTSPASAQTVRGNVVG
ncbi:hypothetical protein GCM10023168_21680 [Fodinibacter luteus]|uniref:DUF1232 domain-containing protein n=1 Tax=Fodinibacter luteus TaxID=552064 RepID=A0ABP8KH54_9MICO